MNPTELSEDALGRPSCLPLVLTFWVNVSKTSASRTMEGCPQQPVRPTLRPSFWAWGGVTRGSVSGSLLLAAPWLPAGHGVSPRVSECGSGPAVPASLHVSETQTLSPARPPESESAFSKTTDELRALIWALILWDGNGALLNKLFFLSALGTGLRAPPLWDLRWHSRSRETLKKMEETGGFSLDLSRIRWGGEPGS